MTEPPEPLGSAAPVAAGDLVVGRDFGPATRFVDPLQDVEFEDCAFTGVVLDSATLRRVVFRGCTFTDCSLVAPVWPDSALLGCAFVGCRLVGVSFGQLADSVVVEPCSFERCRLELCGLAGRDLSGWSFTACSVLECDVADSDLRRATFADCDLSRTTFRGCDLRDASMPGTVGLALDVRDNRVLGLRVDPAAAAGLLAPLGIRVS